MARQKNLRPHEPQLHLAVLSNYKDVTAFNRELNRQVERGEFWKCSMCSCNSYMSSAYGCKSCHPTKKGVKPTSRIYGKDTNA